MNDADLARLFDIARDAAKKSYSPYSRFPVGAAIMTTTGQICSGANVENAAYPLGSCAEASAISAMVALGEKAIANIVVISLQNNPCYPCGGCRQRISEFATPTTRIHVIDVAGRIRSHTVDDLLPHAFGPHAMNKDVRS